jgi:hypothetical protein
LRSSVTYAMPCPIASRTDFARISLPSLRCRRDVGRRSGRRRSSRARCGRRPSARRARRSRRGAREVDTSSTTLRLLVDRVVHGPVLDLAAPPRRSCGVCSGKRWSRSRPTMPEMIRSSVVSGALHVERLDGRPSRRIVTESAIASISLSLCEMMIAGDALRRAGRGCRSSRCAAVLVVQRRGRLVEDQQLHLLGQRLGDLDELLLADADVGDGVTGFSRRPDPAQQLRCRRGLVSVPVDQPARGALVAEEDVLGDGQVRHQRQLLVDDHDAALLAVRMSGELALLALEEDLALVVVPCG